MRSYPLIFFVQLALAMGSCKDQPEKAAPESVLPEGSAASTAPLQNRWKQYKTVSGMGQKDSLPYPECYILIEGSKFVYQREGRDVYTDSIYLDTAYVGKAFHFKDHTGDMLFTIGKKDDSLLLKRFAHEGIYEYFRKEP